MEVERPREINSPHASNDGRASWIVLHPRGCPHGELASLPLLHPGSTCQQVPALPAWSCLAATEDTPPLTPPYPLPASLRHEDTCELPPGVGELEELMADAHFYGVGAIWWRGVLCAGGFMFFSVFMFYGVGARCGVAAVCLTCGCWT
jgi:hypothetical protein